MIEALNGNALAHVLGNQAILLGQDQQQGKQAANDTGAPLPGDVVAISPAARAMIALLKAEDAHRQLQQSLQDQGVVTDPQALLDSAGSHLQDQIDLLGLPPDQPFVFVVETNGRMEIAPPDHPQAGAVRKALQQNPQIEAAIKDASRAAQIRAIGDSLSRAKKAAEANPGAAQFIYDRVKEVANEITEESYTVQVGPEGLTGSLQNG